MHRLDASIATATAAVKQAEGGAGDALTPALVRRVPLLLERAWVRGHLDDYEQALADTERLVTRAPRDPSMWRLRIDALERTHQFAAAREAIATLAQLTGERAADLSLDIDQAASGATDASIAVRAARADASPDARTLTLYAATLAEAGRVDEALALLPRATRALRNNTPAYFAWLLFQWGRIHEQAGQLAAARDLFAEAHRRLPAYVEAIEHLADTYAATGDRAAATALAREAAAADPHPALRTLAYKYADASPAEAAEIAAAWSRYASALPLAFADHAARALLVLGDRAPDALALARDNFRNRPTPQARELLIEAALAVPDPDAACAALGTFPSAGTRGQRFLAWRALEACGRPQDAAALAADLGIAR